MRPLYVCGVGQGAKAAPSSAQAKVEPGSSEARSNVAPADADVAAGFAGPMVVSGAVVSTVQVADAGVGSTLPAASTAATANVWTPSASPT